MVTLLNNDQRDASSMLRKVNRVILVAHFGKIFQILMKGLIIYGDHGKKESSKINSNFLRKKIKERMASRGEWGNVLPI